MTFLTTFFWELMQWIAIVGLILVVAFLWVAVKMLRIGVRAMLKTSPLFRSLVENGDDDA